MLIEKIISLSERQCDESYTSDDWVDLFNMCQDELTPYAKMLATATGISVTVTNKTATIDTSEDDELACAHEILNVYYKPAYATSYVQLRRLRISDLISKGWKMNGEDIVLTGLGTEATGSVKVDYYKKLAHIAYIDGTFTPEVPDIPAEYHGLYVSYLCSKSQQREEESQDKSDFQNEFNTGKQQFYYDRIKKMEPWNLKNVVQQQKLSNE